MADTCEAQNICVTADDPTPLWNPALPWPVELTSGDPAECVDDPRGFEVQGSAKLFGYLQTCPGAVSNPTCDRCSVISQHTNSVVGGQGGGGTWGQINENGVLLEYTQGVQVAWPMVASWVERARLTRQRTRARARAIDSLHQSVALLDHAR